MDWLIKGYIKSLGVIENIWPVIYCELSNNNIIQLFYYILSIAKSLKKLDNHYNISKKGFTTLKIIQLIKPIIIFHIPSLFNLLKAMDAIFCISLYNLNIKC